MLSVAGLTFVSGNASGVAVNGNSLQVEPGGFSVI